MKKLIMGMAFLLILVWQGYAGGIIVTESGPNNGYMLQSRSLKADITIQDGTAITVIEQVFYNASSARLEGWFIFPVPKGAGIKDFMMDVNGKMTKAELLDAQKAKTIYEDIVRRQKDPALLEYAGSDLFRVRIFPIEPRSEKKTSISISQSLNKMGELWEYVLPVSAQGKTVSELREIDIKASITSSADLKTIYSPTHIIASERSAKNKATVRFNEKNHKPDRDFRLYVSSGADKLGLSMLTHREEDGDSFFFLDLNPGYLEETGIEYAKDITFVLDVSGSMSGKKILQAKNALLFCLQKLQPKDHFDIIRFSTEAEALFGKRVENTSENNKKAQQFIRSLQEMGGTNIDEAFELALREKPNSERPHIILFLTDGKPTIGQTDGDALAAEIKSATPKDTRIFSIGIGDDLHTRLLEKISLETRGYHTYISPEEDMEIKISDIYKKLSRPVLTDIQIKAEGDVRISHVYPKEIPDLFAGSSVTLFGKFDKPGALKITVTGKVRGLPFSFSKSGIIPANGANHDFIPSLWATRKIGWMLEEIRLRGENDELKSEIVSLSRKYGIITPYTSYLILEDEEQQIVRRPEIQPRPMIFNRAGVSEPAKEKTKTEYEDMKSISGKGSTRSGNEIQSLNTADAMPTSAQGYSRMQEENTANNSLVFKNAAGRSFYFDGKQWMESEPEKSSRKQEVKFGTDEYFALVSKFPELNGILALGQNVNFVYRGTNIIVSN